MRIFFARHAERIDIAFGYNWIEKAFDQDGKYQRINLNMPNRLPTRLDKKDFIGDSPITEIGKFQARLTGDALGSQGYKFSYCYVSPSLRCIQTAHQILKAQGVEKQVKMRIDASLFETTSLYKKGIPKFLTKESLLKYGFNIDTMYKPLLTVERLKPKEGYVNYYHRSFNMAKFLASQHEIEGGNILVVGHAGTLEACTRQITGSQIRSLQEFNSVISKTPFLGICLIEKEQKQFKLKHSGIPPLAHHSNINFDAASVLQF